MGQLVLIECCIQGNFFLSTRHSKYNLQYKKSVKSNTLFVVSLKSVFEDGRFYIQTSQNYQFITGHSWSIYLNGCKVFQVKEIKLI